MILDAGTDLSTAEWECNLRPIINGFNGQPLEKIGFSELTITELDV
ncbi:MAG TPA: hypothetical protein VMA53_21215 [Stellaceae bacterium]|nr:hypothetical protein [Stellaceae bacterium]